MADSSVCEHCDQLWALQNDDGFYVLEPETMDKAAQFYEAGKTGVMKKWPEMVGACATWEQEIQAAKDGFADSDEELDVVLPETDFQGF